MKNRLKAAAKWTGNILVAILSYIYLMIDRAILVPFPFVPSYSLREYMKGPDRFLSYTIMRTGFVALVAIIILIIKYIF